MTGCIIVASGPSAAGFIPPDGVTVIAVNGAIEWLPRADIWFTLDPSPANLKRMRERTAGARYYAAVTPDRELPDGVTRLERVSVHSGTTGGYWFRRWGCIATMSDEPRKINTGNSAWGALQLARLLGHKRIMLVGVDGSQSARVEGGNPNNLSHLPELFNGTADDISVINCGLMDCRLPKMTIPEGIEWITSQA